MTYRTKFDTISQILEAANGYNATRSKIAYKSFLNYGQLKEYLTILSQKGLLCYDENTQTFKTTEKGLRFLQIYSQLDNMLKEERGGGEQPPIPPPQQQQM